MLQTKIVIKTKYRLSGSNKDAIRSFIGKELEGKVITDFYIEEKSCPIPSVDS